jgi:Ca-activated chloride channel homolog
MYRRVIEYLRAPEVQRAIAERTFRRPAVPGVPGVQNFGGPVELPFPAETAVIEALSASYFDRRHRPSRTIYLLDTNGSMAEYDRTWDLKHAVWTLAATRADYRLTERLRRFRTREEMTFLSFSGNPARPQTIRVPEDDPSPDRQRAFEAVQRALWIRGDDSIYDSLRTAYRLAGQQIAADPDRFTAIVLMTDGENTTGTGISGFREFVASLPPELRGVPVFCVLFGDVNTEEMKEVARLTGGRTYAVSRSLSWAEIFQEIRGYV